MKFDTKSKPFELDTKGAKYCWWIGSSNLNAIAVSLMIAHTPEKEQLCSTIYKIFEPIQYDDIVNHIDYDDDNKDLAKFIKVVSERMCIDKDYNIGNAVTKIGDETHNKYLSQGLVKDIYKKMKEETLNKQQIDKLLKYLNTILRLGFVLKYKDNFASAFEKIDIDRYSEAYYEKCADELASLSSELLRMMREHQMDDIEQSFDLECSSYSHLMSEIDSENNNKIHTIYTGIIQLNASLFPGFTSGRVYVFTGNTGDGKSKLLMKIALDAKSFNRQYTTTENKTPMVVYLSLENDTKMTALRIRSFLYESLEWEDKDEYNNLPTSQAKTEFLLKSRSLAPTKANPIVVRNVYRAGVKTNINDLYSMFAEFEASGYKPIILVLDYLKLLQPSSYKATLKEQLDNVTLELEAFAKHYNIPVVTAHQTNRATYTNALDKKFRKLNVSDAYSLASIGNAWDIAENVDYVCNIFTMQDQSGSFYLGFKVEKESRDITSELYKTKYLRQWYQPYREGSRIALRDDMPMDIDAFESDRTMYPSLALSQDEWESMINIPADVHNHNVYYLQQRDPKIFVN